MVRLPRIVLPGYPLHIVQRGNNRQACFFCDEDRRFYLEGLKDAASRHGCRVHAYVLMTNDLRNSGDSNRNSRSPAIRGTVTETPGVHRRGLIGSWGAKYKIEPGKEENMPRMARVVAPGYPHHVTQRGNRRQAVFLAGDDWSMYLSLIRAACREAGTRVLAYCLMPNHVHFVMVPSRRSALRELGVSVTVPGIAQGDALLLGLSFWRWLRR